jgi:hypothetical protein
MRAGKYFEPQRIMEEGRMSACLFYLETYKQHIGDNLLCKQLKTCGLVIVAEAGSC